MLQLLRPTDVEGLFGKEYKELATSIEQARYALPVIRTLTDKWMTGAPLCDLERAAGTPETKVKTCEVARHYAVRLASDMAFVAGLPARIIAARKATDDTVAMPIVLATLAGAVRRGCDSPEALANAVHLGREVSRVAARLKFEDIRKHIRAGDPAEPFDDTLDRVRLAHGIAMFDVL